MREGLQPGLEYVHTYTVATDKTVPHVYPETPLFRNMPEVFATAFMVGLMEWACMEALAPYLEEGERTVGTAIDVSHTAATPPGMKVAVTVKLIELEGRRTRWQVSARDEQELIGEGTHERFVIDYDKFETRLARKKAGA